MDDCTDRLEYALTLAHTMLARIENGGSYGVAQWDATMARIEYALDMPTERAKAYATDIGARS